MLISFLFDLSRLLLMLALSATSFVVVYLLPNTTASFAVAACMGLILSLDLCSMLMRTFTRLWKGSKYEDNSKGSLFMSVAKWLHFLLMIILVAVIVSVVDYFISKQKKSELLDIFGYILIACLVVFQLLGRLQSTYLFFGLVRNPVYATWKKGRLRRALGLGRKIFLNSCKCYFSALK